MAGRLTKRAGVNPIYHANRLFVHLNPLYQSTDDLPPCGPGSVSQAGFHLRGEILQTPDNQPQFLGFGCALLLGAAEAFGAYELLPLQAAPVLVAALGSQDPALRAAAEMSLRRAGPEAIPQLIASLKEGPPPAQQAAAALLRAYGAQARDTVPVLVGMLRAANEEQRRGAVMLLQSIGEPAVPALCEALKDPDPKFRDAAALAMPLNGKAAKDAVPALLALLSDPDPQVRKRGILALEHLRQPGAEVVAALGKALKDADPDVRRTAVFVIGNAGPGAKEYVPALLELLKVDDWSLRSVVVSTLQKIGPAAKEACPDLELLSNETRAFTACVLYWKAQEAYHTNHKAEDGTYHEYAQKLKGAKDSLATVGYEHGGPILAPALCEAEGQPKAGPAYRGYRFKILKAQGDLALGGGKKSYILDGHMTQGHALVAYPVEYGVTGRKTLLVSYEGKVFAKDLGQEAPALISAMNEFNPNQTWSCTTIQDQEKGEQPAQF